MKNFKAAVDAFLNDESGASAVEYALIVALIAAAVATAVSVVGDRAGNAFSQVSGKLPTSTTAP